MRVVAALLLSLLLAVPAVASDGLVARPSKHSAKETMDKLAAALEAKGIKPLARVNHAAAAQAAGLQLKPTEVILFGNPKLGTPLMQSNRRAAIDLPMKMLVWEDDKGKAWLAYLPPDGLKRRYGIKGKEQVEALKTMSGVLEGFAKAATE